MAHLKEQKSDMQFALLIQADIFYPIV